MFLQRKWKMMILMVLGLLISTTSVAFAQDPDAGQEVWGETGCQRCHGAEGEGLWAGPLAGNEKTAEEWITQVRTPRRNMPAYSAQQMTDEQLINVHAYLTSLTKPDGFTPQQADVAEDAHPGQQLMVQKRCVACHSEMGPINGFIKRGEAPTVEGVLTQVRTPRSFMPSYTAEQVSDEEVASIVEFLNVEFDAAAETPATLPETGQTNTTTVAWAWLLLGFGLMAGGLLLGKRVLT